MTFPCCRPSAVVLILVVSAWGCGGNDGPKLATVRGQVKLGGKPLTQAAVLFVPEEGRSSTGVTDKDGKYELGYARDRKGAVLGKHQVRIGTYLRANADGKTVPETVPARYNVHSELSRDVKSGKNEINFELDATGPIVQPSATD